MFYFVFLIFFPLLKLNWINFICWILFYIFKTFILNKNLLFNSYTSYWIFSVLYYLLRSWLLSKLFITLIKRFSRIIRLTALPIKLSLSDYRTLLWNFFYFNIFILWCYLLTIIMYIRILYVAWSVYYFIWLFF